MTRLFTKAVSLGLAAFLAFSVFTGCSKAKTDDTKSAPAASTASTAAPASTEATYPLKNAAPIKYWLGMHVNWSGYAKNFGELETGKELIKRTGVKVEFLHPPLGQEKDTFNLMVAAGDLPDLIEYRWTDFPGGPGVAINNGTIIKLNDVIEKYSPNLKKYFGERPQYSKEAKMDDGTYYFYPFLRDGPELLNTNGPIVRKDLLDDVGLQVPETMDDWYNMLKAFKDKKSIAIPLTAEGANGSSTVLNIFAAGFNTISDFYIKDGKIRFGAMEPAFKDMLVYLNKLYAEGLLDKNFAANDRKTQDSNMINGKAGATIGSGGQQLGVWQVTVQPKDPKYKLVAAKWPVQKKGDKLTVGAYTTGLDRNAQVAITGKSKNVETAARFLDYGYSKEGKLFYNFGTENVSWKMVNGVPTYTDLVMKNPDKMTPAQAIAKYARGNMAGPFPQDPGYILQYYELPEQKAALKTWSDHNKTVMPLLTPTVEESAEVAKIMGDVNTYLNEMMVKYVMGTASLSEYDKYVEQLKKMNIEKAIALKQQALDRYNKR